VKFWDSSALVPLCVAQPTTQRARAVHREDPDVVVWWGSVIECASAISRVHRDGFLSEKDVVAAQATLAHLRTTWFEIQPGDSVREQAIRLLRLHPLRAADALQLAAAGVDGISGDRHVRHVRRAASSGGGTRGAVGALRRSRSLESALVDNSARSRSE
jgi:predicted nucleic acid-binding protein